MARPSLGYKKLVQLRLTEEQYRVLTRYAAQHNITVAELTRQQLRPLIAQIISGVPQSNVA
jgi:hypothetical protein